MVNNGGISRLLQRNTQLVIALLFCVNGMWIFLLMVDMSMGLKALSLGVNTVFFACIQLLLKLDKRRAARIASSLFLYLTLSNTVYLIALRFTSLYAFISEAGFEAFLTAHSSYAMIIFFTVCFLQPILLPVPEAVTVVAGSVVLSPAVAAAAALSGTLLGIVVMFWLVRYGSNNIFDPGKNIALLQQYRKLVSKNEILFLGLLFILPILPDEIVCLGAGLSAVRFPVFLTVAAVSKLVTSVSLSYSVLIAQKLSMTNTQIMTLLAAIVVIVSLVKWSIDRLKEER